MGLFGGIFDGLGDDINSLFGTSLTGAQLATGAKDVAGIAGALLGGSGGPSVQASQDASVLRGTRLVSALDTGTTSPMKDYENKSPIHTRDEFQAPDAVDANTIEDQWNNRLSKYAEITRQTGVSETGR